MEYVGIIIFIVGMFVINEMSKNNPTPEGDFICPKCGRKTGVEKGLSIGSPSPWQRFECRSCGFEW